MSAVANGFCGAVSNVPNVTTRSLRSHAGGRPMANGFSGTSDIDALASSMGAGQPFDFAAACLAAPYDNAPDAGHVP